MLDGKIKGDAPKPSLALVSRVEIRETANLYRTMADDYSLAIEAAEKVTPHADTRDMKRKRKGLLIGRRLLLEALEQNK